MADAKLDNNYKRTLTAVTDDVAATISRLLVDPSTGRLKVSATVSSGAFTGSGTIQYITKWSGGSVLTISSILDSGGSISVGSANLNPKELTANRILGFPDSAGTLTLSNGLANYLTRFTGVNSLGTSQISESGGSVSVGSATLNAKELTAQRSFGFPDSSGTFNLQSRAINTTAPITGGGDLSADRTVAIPVATSLANGYLASTDWTTFNNKATSNGTVYLGGTGTANQVAYFSGGSTLASSGSLYFNNTNGFLGINNNNPTAILDIFVSTGTAFSIRNAGGTLFVVGADGRISAGSVNSVLEILPNGNVGIGTASPVSYQLDVGGPLGSGNFATQLRISEIRIDYNNNEIRTGSNAAQLVLGSTGNVGIGTTGPATKLEVNGVATGTNFISSVATGTQPYACTSTTVNTNLNADLLDGLHSSSFATSNGTVYLGGTGTVNEIAYFSAGSTLTSNGSLYWNGANLTFKTNLIPSSGTAYDLGSSGSAFGTTFSANLRISSTAYFNAEYSNGSASAGTAINWKNGNKQFIEVNATSTLSFGTPFGPCNLVLRTDQGNLTGGVLTWPSNTRWSGGSVLSVGSNKVDIVSLYFSGSFYYGQIAKNFAY